MFELPEFVTLARQINDTLKGKEIKRGVLGNTPHKFVWYNRKHNEFERLIKGKKIGETWAKAKWLFMPLLPEYILLIGEFGGKVLYHPVGSRVPKKYHLYITFIDGSFLTATTQMWGAIELYERGKEKNRKYIKGMKLTPIDAEFTYEYFCNLIDSLTEKKSVKGLLTQDQLVPGLGNAIAQDIMFKARLHPQQAVDELTKPNRKRLYNATKKIVHETIRKGGRYDEYDLYNKPGKYIRVMDRNRVGQPCPVCGSTIEKIQYLGGTCYFCPSCQKLHT